MSASTPECVCPYCAHKIDAASCLFDEPAVPKPGGISVCFYCGAAVVFTDGLMLRKPVLKDLDGLSFQSMVELVNIQIKIREYHASKN